MKKVLAVFFMVLMVLSVSFGVCAAGEFIQSPSGNNGPVIVDASNESEDCFSTLVVTGFKDKDQLTDAQKQALQTAYDDIADCDDLSKLCADLSTIADNAGIAKENLAVSDLFYVDHDDCADHSNHGAFNVTMKSDTFKNFVALMCYTEDGWVIVEGAKVELVDGEYQLVFKAEVFGPYAVVVNSAMANDTPNTGDTSVLPVCMAVMMISAFAVVATVKKTKKQAV